MIEGEENFRLKYQKINEAKSSIYIANYDLDPNLRLIRGDTVPQSLQIHGLIASPCRSESESKIKNSTNDNYIKQSRYFREWKTDNNHNNL